MFAEALATLPGARVNPDPPHCHEFQLYLPYSVEALRAANLELAETERIWFTNGWSEAAPGLAMAEITARSRSLEWTAEEVLAAGRRLLELADKAQLAQ
jgi:hypothetical protein